MHAFAAGNAALWARRPAHASDNVFIQLIGAAHAARPPVLRVRLRRGGYCAVVGAGEAFAKQQTISAVIATASRSAPEPAEAASHPRGGGGSPHARPSGPLHTRARLPRCTCKGWEQAPTSQLRTFCMPLAHCRSLAAGVAYRTLDWTRPRSSGTRAYAMAGRGAFIVFEGVDRSGKSTQAGKLADALKDQGVSACGRLPGVLAVLGAGHAEDRAIARRRMVHLCCPPAAAPGGRRAVELPGPQDSHRPDHRRLLEGQSRRR